jgi:hypothetical protein
MAPAVLRDRRGEGVAGVAGDLLTSGERVLLAVADAARRRASLEALLGGLAQGGLAVASWDAMTGEPGLAREFRHLVALDPPPGGMGDPLLGACPLGHLAWGPAEAEFALTIWRRALDLRPALAEVWRALRGYDGKDPEAVRRALAGGGDYPRSPELCARLVRVFGELEMLEFVPSDGGGPACLPRARERTELERSPTYRACRVRLEAIERALAPELGSEPGLAAQA